MNILFVSHGGRRNGGAQNVLFSLLKSIHNSNSFNCHCLFPEGGNFYEEIKSLDIQTHIVKFKWWAGFELDTLYRITDFFLNIRSSVDAVVKIIEKNNIDLIVSNTITMAEGALAAKITKKPHIWYVHEILSKDPKLKHMLKLEFLYPIMLDLSKNIVVVSEACKKEFEHVLSSANKERKVVMGDRAASISYPIDKIKVIYNGVFVPENVTSINNNNTILSVGGICRRKGQMDLLKASRLVIDEIPDAKFLLAGSFWERGYRQELLEERERLGIGKKFAFEKWQYDMVSFLELGCMLVSPSTCESFGLSLLEGMAKCLPVIATDSGGPSEIVVNGVTGLLIPVGDYKELAESIIWLLKNKDVGVKMGLAGYQRVKENFDHNKFIQSFINLLNS
jgi:glycosyltransferase involved in cell wall biosynthesis